MSKKKKNIKKCFFLLVAFFISKSLVYGFNSSTNINFKTDSIHGYLNDDEYCDLIVLESDNKTPPNLKLAIFFGTKTGSFELRKDITFIPEGTMFAPDINIDSTKNICMTYTYYKTMTTYIYKYFKQFDDWFLYCSHDNIAENEFSEKPYDFWPLYETRAIGIEDGEWVNIVSKSQHDSLVIKQNRQYDIFLEEYKTKKYQKIYNYKVEDFYSIVRNIGINESNVQKLNDIGFFLCEAKCFNVAVKILECITYEYRKRTVAYINLGDAYWGLDNKNDAKEAYEKYIELMKANGKQSKIPQRIFDRVK